jgi:ATP-binding cassette subfamily F protein 3
VLTFDGVALRRGIRQLFHDATFTIHRGEKAGITGANGTGKSSLLALIRHELEPESGRIELPSGLVLAHVAQEVVDSTAAAIEFVVDGDRELRETQRALESAERAGDGMTVGNLHARLDAIGGYDARSRAARLMHGLGFAPRDVDRPVSEFSGGWRVRLALARALMCRSDLLLLDEPTNHLDLDAICWLEQWLLAYPGTLLLIAHDRAFLDRIVNRILHIEGGAVRLYTGNYTAFETARADQLAQQRSLYQRQQREIRHISAFIERFRAKASKARQAQSRLKALERMQTIAPAHVDSPFEFAFESPAKLPDPLLKVEEAAVGYEGHPVVADVTISLAPGDRVALLGRNGAGKSTVMKLLAGALPASSGERIEARDLATGYFAQLELEQLLPGESALDHLRRFGGEAAGAALEQALRDHLGHFGFRGDRVFEPVGAWSGGEKARLVLAILACRHPNLLLLDEPTNHLDLEMRHALALALQEYPGAVVLVSHDRYLLELIADRLYVVAGGRMIEFDGDLEAYEAALRTEASGARSVRGDAPATERRSRRDARREEARFRSRLSPLRAEVTRLEAEVERLSASLDEVEAALADPQVYASEEKERLLGLIDRRNSLSVELRSVEQAWVETAEALERAQRDEAP